MYQSNVLRLQHRYNRIHIKWQHQRLQDEGIVSLCALKIVSYFSFMCGDSTSTHTHTHDISSNRRRICDEKRTTDKRAVYNERPTHTVHTHCNLAFCVRIYYYFRNTHNAREIDVIPFLVKWQRLPAEHSGAMTSFIAERVTTWSCGIYENKFLACEMSGRARCSGLFLSSTTQ